MVHELDGCVHPYITEQNWEGPEPGLHPLSPEEYAKYGGAWCPVCGSYDIEGTGGGFDIEGTFAYNSIACLDCGASWEDKYRLVGYATLAGESGPLP